MRKTTTFLFLISLLLLSGCGIRTSHEVQVRNSTAVLEEATLDQLVQNVNDNADKLKTLKASVDIDTSVVEQKKEKVTDNPQVAGYVLMRKPEMLRMRVLVPVVRNTMVDMVSDGSHFSLAIPPKSKFIVGSNKQPTKPSPQPLENLRPQHISDALLLKPIDPKTEIPVLENTTEIVRDPKTKKSVQQGTYTLVIIDKDNDGYYLSRKIVFSRTDLLPHEQSIFNRQGQLATLARYENFAKNSNIMFPGIISIDRPIEGYTMVLSFTKLDVNVPLTDEQFVLAQPPGSQLVNLDNQSSAASAAIQDQENKKPRQ